MKSSAFLLLAGAALAFQNLPEPQHRPVEFQAAVQDKNFYLLSALQRSAGARAAFKSDPVLGRMSADRLSALDTAAASCKLDLECSADRFRWTDPQIAEAARALGALYSTSPAVRTLADGPLRASGMYVRYQAATGPELLERSWSECMRGINHAIDVYGLGKAPRYPAIDSITLDPNSDTYRRLVQLVTVVMEDDRASLDLVFAPSLRFAIELMLMNHRDEAGRFEPIETGENAAAFRRVKSVDWNRYPYTAIVVPGSGNDRPAVRLSPFGELRDELAAKRYRDGKAPFVIVSGGFVHPTQTEFAEAIEMKHDLMMRFGIPENAIIVDPYARHTTTNMRNAARLLYRYAIPFDRKALVTTDPAQSESIESPQFNKRCMDELGYVPFRLLARKSPFDVEFLPTRESLHADPLDPLDP